MTHDHWLPKGGSDVRREETKEIRIIKVVYMQAVTWNAFCFSQFACNVPKQDTLVVGRLIVTVGGLLHLNY